MPQNKPSDEEIGHAAFHEAERKANIDLLALYYWERYAAFINAGFSPSEAMEIIKARGIKI